MSAQNQGRQSPPPEEQSGKQQQDTPASGKGVNDKDSNNKDDSKSQLEVRSLWASQQVSKKSILIC